MYEKKEKRNSVNMLKCLPFPLTHFPCFCTSHKCVEWSQTYDAEIVDDYITGVDEVGVDPTVPVKAAVPVDPPVKVDTETDVKEFKEYDLKEYDTKDFVEKPYDYGNYGDYGDYGDYGTTNAKPTPEVYEEEFGPGVPAETDISVSDYPWERNLVWRKLDLFVF